MKPRDMENISPTAQLNVRSAFHYHVYSLNPEKTLEFPATKTFLESLESAHVSENLKNDKFVSWSVTLPDDHLAGSLKEHPGLTVVELGHAPPGKRQSFQEEKTYMAFLKDLHNMEVANATRDWFKERVKDKDRMQIWPTIPDKGVEE